MLLAVSLLAFLGRLQDNFKLQTLLPCCCLCTEISLLHTYRRLQQENHRWYWSSFTLATAGALCYLAPVMLRSDDMTDMTDMLPLLQGCLLVGSTAFLVALRIVLFAYSQCVCD